MRGYFAQCRATLPAEVAGSTTMYVRGRIALGFPAIFKPLFFYSTSEQNVRTTAHLCIQQASSPNSCHPLSRVCPSLPYRLGMRRPSPSDTPAGQGPKELPYCSGMAATSPSDEEPPKKNCGCQPLAIRLPSPGSGWRASLHHPRCDVHGRGRNYHRAIQLPSPPRQPWLQTTCVAGSTPPRLQAFLSPGDTAATPWRYGCHPWVVEGAHDRTIHRAMYTDAHVY
jgi:hypothetical protein